MLVKSQYIYIRLLPGYLGKAKRTASTNRADGSCVLLLGGLIVVRSPSVQPAAWPSIPTPPEVITLAHFFPYCQEMVDVKIKSTMSQYLAAKLCIIHRYGVLEISR